MRVGKRVLNKLMEESPGGGPSLAEHVARGRHGMNRNDHHRHRHHHHHHRHRRHHHHRHHHYLCRRRRRRRRRQAERDHITCTKKKFKSLV